VKYIRADYEGPRNPRTGERLMWGHSPGFELRNDSPEALGVDATLPSGFWRYFVFDDPKWDGSRFDFDKGVAFADRKVGAAS
jgi:hypothetical protein